MNPSPDFEGRPLPAAPDDTAARTAYALRFSVYCLEYRFLDARVHPDGLETDRFDPFSAHFGAYNRWQELVGYVRLVPPDAQGRLPWQAHCATLLNGVHLPPANGSAEISRLMVRDDYRRRRGDTLAGTARAHGGRGDSLNRRTASPQILLTLYRQMYRHSLQQGLRYWYAAMERPLARSLRRLDFAFHAVGEQADYFGPVAPYLADLRELEQHLAHSRPELLAWMRSGDEPAA